MGEQVAYNKCEHCNVELHTNDSGEYYPVVNRLDKFTLIRGEYHPIGNRFQYPRNWGKRKGAMILLEHRIGEKQKQLDEAVSELAKLSACLEKVHLWENDSKE
jgi:transcription initiation factor IIE alpha subunit